MLPQRHTVIPSSGYYKSSFGPGGNLSLTPLL